MHRDLEQVGNRIHDVGMRAVRENVLYPLVQVLIAGDVSVSL